MSERDRVVSPRQSTEHVLLFERTLVCWPRFAPHLGTWIMIIRVGGEVSCAPLLSQQSTQTSRQSSPQGLHIFVLTLLADIPDFR